MINQRSPLRTGTSGANDLHRLIVDGEIVELNRIRLPVVTPIIDERFKEP